MNNDELERLATKIEEYADVEIMELLFRNSDTGATVYLNNEAAKTLVASWRERGQTLDELKSLAMSIKEELRENQ